ncbi:extensin family protein [Sinorhizobium sp. BG8]|uniref:extensin-like domain-containing protein n=1 Tax=Sinorhizobium sp. BG8 TaxID=2613773 RepID=UPI00193D2F69|nr:extensin family protein [Sinorhizobium sp. BG8]QRM56331.1 extensin [Sinorhizobium sp. BG8]
MAAIAALMFLSGASLPEVGPLPETKPSQDTGDTSGSKPEGNSEETKGPVGSDVQGKNLPAAKEASPPGETEGDKPTEIPVPSEKEEPAPPVEKEDAAAFARCVADLKSLGATFKETSRIDDGNGCGIDRPVSVSALGGGVDLRPEGVVRCETALALARWTKEAVIPALGTAMPGEKLTTLNQASGYVCRKRNNAENGKISEHARGNAVDIAGLRLGSGKTFSIAPRDKDSTLEGAFQRAITASACLYFTTVLDPGSDAAHETHLHLDVIHRTNGYRYCW